ncbi:hypothetical protein LINPERHAP2_LOCUS16940 [Linum perenne]
MSLVMQLLIASNAMSATIVNGQAT